MTGKRGRALACLILSWLLLAGALEGASAQTKPEGEMRWALYVTLSPVWFDPGEVTGQLTPFWILYALHDALVKPMPGNMLSPSLAESWTVSADQRVYEFKLREGLKFHNGDPFTADDVKFSFHRAKGSKTLHDKVREVVVVGPSRVRFILHEPWPDFMTFYGSIVSGSGWVVPKKYVERVGDDGFKRAPVGLGPYKFVSHAPGIELVMEANEGYWRKVPSVKRLVFKSVPESTTRMAMLKRGEVDIAYLLDVPQAQEVKRDPNLKLAFSGGIATFYLDFLDQWDPKSPWHDARPGPPGTTSRGHSSSPCPSNRTPTTPRRRSSSSRRRATRTASTPASCISSRRTSRWARRSSSTCGRSGSGSRCGRWSAAPTWL
ncbi:MAG: SBP bac 5 protein [Candidatus Rokubacteria bacterium]|nr:SBP bac 5 protein [Candidatus Rokubacteria bacterium]